MRSSVSLLLSDNVDHLLLTGSAAINATGVVLHTNLGRAPLAPAALEAIAEVARAASTLEYDVALGARGSRHVHCAALLAELTGAEDALVVNNCAAALVLALQTFAAGRETIVVVADRLAAFGNSVRADIDASAELGDQDTADLFTEVSRAIDKHLWFVEAHLQG